MTVTNLHRAEAFGHSGETIQQVINETTLAPKDTLGQLPGHQQVVIIKRLKKHKTQKIVLDSTSKNNKQIAETVNNLNIALVYGYSKIIVVE